MALEETDVLEYKEKPTDTFLKTVSAYANYHDGKIIFGINDNGEVVGLDNLSEERERIENKINDTFHPTPSYSLETNRDNKTITLTVYESPDKPYLVKGKTYKRNGASTIEVDKVEHGRLVLEGSNMTFDELEYPKGDLTFDILAKRMIEVVDIDSFGSDVMRTLGLITPTGSYTNAAAILADTNDFGGIDIVRFGATQDIILSRATFKGISAVAQFDGAMEQFVQYYQYEKIVGTKREMLYSIPLEAFREAVANAIVHRAWDVKSNVAVRMYDDHIEVASPGPLPPGITEEEYLSGSISHLRNPIIAQVFYRLRLIEMFGTGIARINRAYSEASTKPSFYISQQSIVVSLPTINGHSDEALSDVEEAIIELLGGGALLTRLEIESVIGISKDRVIRSLNSLIDRKLIHKQGHGRGTKYGAR